MKTPDRPLARARRARRAAALALGLALGVAPACTKTERVTVQPAQGALFVSVTVADRAAVGARVETEPATVGGLTDEFGTLLLRGVPAGVYVVTATLEGVGAGRAAVSVPANDLGSAEIVIRR